ncbi:MAG: hypothetical protein WBH61_02625 [Candidatus Methylomirabilis sp.]
MSVPIYPYITGQDVEQAGAYEQAIGHQRVQGYRLSVTLFLEPPLPLGIEAALDPRLK